MMNFSGSIYEGLASSYIGHAGYEGDDNWGKFLYLEYEYDKNRELTYKEIRSHSQYVTEFHDDEFIFFVLRFTDKQRIGIVDPFIVGQYSKIDRDYVASHFPKYTQQGSISNNWRILVKDDWNRPDYIPSLKSYWEIKTGCSLPDNAELWSRPMKRDEVYNYELYHALTHETADSISLQ